MVITQISVSMENSPGALLNISEILGREGVNIRAISVADTSDISTVRKWLCSKGNRSACR